jgi:hypothetical protein
VGLICGKGFALASFTRIVPATAENNRTSMSFVAEGAVTGYIGYKIYNRAKKT